MVLKLLLDSENSLFYQRLARDEVEKFLLNAQKVLKDTELKELITFINDSPQYLDAKKIKKGLTVDEKRHFLNLIQQKASPYGHDLYQIRSGRVGPLMTDAEFLELNNDKIIQLLLKERDYYSIEHGFTDVLQNWEVFAPKHSERAWEILQSELIEGKVELWESTAWALTKSKHEYHSQVELCQKQWDILTSDSGFIECYLRKNLNSEPIIEWLNSIATNLKLSDEIYLLYWFRLWDLSSKRKINVSTIHLGDEKKESDYLSTAINDPRGKLAEGIIDAFYRHGPKVNEKIPHELSKAFNAIFSSNDEGSWLAQLIFARHFRNLFITDPAWTKKQLLPSFDIHNNKNRSARMWVAFLYNPNLNFETFKLLKPSLVELVIEWDNIFSSDIFNILDLRRNLINLLTFYRLMFPETISKKEFKSFFSELNCHDLERLFPLFIDLLREPIDKNQDQIFWDKTLRPFLDNFWSSEKRSSEISLNFLELAAQCPNALISIRNYLGLKPFLIQANQWNNGFICSLLGRECTRFNAPFLSLENAKAFFDLFSTIIGTVNGIKQIPLEQRWEFEQIKSFLAIFSDRFPEIKDHTGFKRVSKIFQ